MERYRQNWSFVEAQIKGPVAPKKWDDVFTTPAGPIQVVHQHFAEFAGSSSFLQLYHVLIPTKPWRPSLHADTVITQRRGGFSGENK